MPGDATPVLAVVIRTRKSARFCSRDGTDPGLRLLSLARSSRKSREFSGLYTHNARTRAPSEHTSGSCDESCSSLCSAVQRCFLNDLLALATSKWPGILVIHGEFSRILGKAPLSLSSRNSGPQGNPEDFCRVLLWYARGPRIRPCSRPSRDIEGSLLEAS